MISETTTDAPPAPAERRSELNAQEIWPAPPLTVAVSVLDTRTVAAVTVELLLISAVVVLVMVLTTTAPPIAKVGAERRRSPARSCSHFPN